MDFTSNDFVPSAKMITRFWKKVEVGAADDCWEWSAGLGGDGYGHFAIGYEVAQAHRFSYRLVNGPIPAGHLIHHECRNPRCVNPRHLTAMTLRDHTHLNARATETHCPNGHPWEGNLRLGRDGGRVRRLCRICDNENHRKWWRRKRSAATRMATDDD